ncbi:MAG: (d)CMP kinase [Lachnospiraceae bacterium]|jgi:cytidylate kinase|nr:(d)CMP kinase [Lachnospiraceae bacterium]
MSFNVAIDGPAGAGKSTVARAVARQLEMIYVDTGAMYRAMALYMLREKVALEDVEGIVEKCQHADISIRYENGTQVVLLNGENVNPFLRTEEVGNAASVVSPIAEVREKMKRLQKELAAKNDCVMDGRDIGTCVLPKAQLKIYLTASSQVRAERRYLELAAKGEQGDIAKIRADIEERDYRDMHRENSPLTQAEDAIFLDTSHMTAEEAVEAILKLCRERRG